MNIKKIGKLSTYLNKFNKVWEEKCSTYSNSPSILEAVHKIIVIGDIHGDMKELLSCLKLAEVIDDMYNWIGGKAVIVQVGDQIDSCRFDGKNQCNDPSNYNMDEAHDIMILKFMTELHNKAVLAGGAVYSLLGNHELMNVEGDMTYVSYSNIRKFDNYNGISNGMEARKHSFLPGNEIANFLACTRKVALIIGSNLFVHAGIIPEMVYKYNDITTINMILTLFLLNELDNPHLYKDIITSNTSSPLWTRIFGKNKIEPAECNRLLEPMKKVYQVGKIIVGHTPQMSTGIKSKCSGNIWNVDVGVSHAFDMFDKNIKQNGKSKHRQAQVLVIIDDGKEIYTLPQKK